MATRYCNRSRMPRCARLQRVWPNLFRSSLLFRCMPLHCGPSGRLGDALAVADSHRRLVICERLRETGQGNGPTQVALGLRTGIEPSVTSSFLALYDHDKQRAFFLTVERSAKYLSTPARDLHVEHDEPLAILRFS